MRTGASSAGGQSSHGSPAVTVVKRGPVSDPRRIKPSLKLSSLCGRCVQGLGMTKKRAEEAEGGRECERLRWMGAEEGSSHPAADQGAKVRVPLLGHRQDLLHGHLLRVLGWSPRLLLPLRLLLRSEELLSLEF